MNKIFKGLLWFAFYVGSLAVVAVVTSYISTNFLGIGPVPVRSAFAGRLPGTLEGNGPERRFQFFYTTNRVNNSETFDGRGNELAETLTKGTFDALISPYMPITPFVWFETTNIKLAGRQVLPEATFKEKLRKAVQDSPQKSVLVIVWGFRDWFQSAALKTAFTAYALDINTPVVLFDWPGNMGEGPRGYAASQVSATQTAPVLGQTLEWITKETGAERVWLMGSSLGCQTICEAIKSVASQPNTILTEHKLAEVVLSAPDVAADAFNDKFAESISKTTKHLTSYVSSNDRALLMSHWINGSRRLGRTAEITTPPEQRKTQYEFEEAYELLELQAKGARNFSVVDATPINNLRNLHHFFTDSPIFFDDLYQRFLQPDDIVSRRLHRVNSTAQGTHYWILWND